MEMKSRQLDVCVGLLNEFQIRDRNLRVIKMLACTFSYSVVSDSLRTHELQHAGFPVLTKILRLHKNIQPNAFYRRWVWAKELNLSFLQKNL
jgi:hypothetical protein